MKLPPIYKTLFITKYNNIETKAKIKLYKFK